MRKTETKITQSIIDEIVRAGGDAWHVHGSALQRAGEPDIDGWIPYEGVIYHLKLEVKTEVGEVSPLQQFRLEKYERAGYVTGVITSCEELWKLLQSYGNTN